MTFAPIQDVICLAVPDKIDPAIYLGHTDPSVTAAFFEQLTRMAHATVWAQWPTRPPKRVEWDSISWLVTARVEDVAQFQPSHDCERCRDGNRKAEIFLLEHPGRFVAMANITYTPIW